MPRVVPSDVVGAVDRMFPDMAQRPDAFPNVAFDDLPRLAALVRLVEAVPEDLIVPEPQRYAELTASVSCLRAMADVFQASRQPLPLRLRGFQQNPIAMIRAVMATCPDEAPARGTRALAFIRDKEFRESIRLDISAANQNLANGEWKGATVLAGSAIEALLLWALQKQKKGKTRSLTAAIGALLANKTLTHQPHAKPEKWGLHEYVEVAAHLGLIKPDSAAAVRLAKDFRNLIHPGRAVRRGQKCDRATALQALAAAEAVMRDLGS